jgi:hypothetical protein
LNVNHEALRNWIRQAGRTRTSVMIGPTTQATVLNTVAILDRVRALKQAARDAKTVARHQQALTAARRREELQEARRGLR